MSEPSMHDIPLRNGALDIGSPDYEAFVRERVGRWFDVPESLLSSDMAPEKLRGIKPDGSPMTRLIDERGTE